MLAKMQDYYYYRKLAVKILQKFNANLAKRIIKDDDLFGNIISELMIADWKWNESLHAGKEKEHILNARMGFLKRRFLWTIKTYKKSIIKDTITYYDNLFATHDYNTRRIDAAEEVEKVFSILSQREKEIMTRIYIDGETKSGVARDLGISRERVGQITNKARHKIWKQRQSA